ncbi:hypothetical protein, conserved [Eimeria praecox]|uniref:Cullin family profile domain-containing protein n=1 Tax=Eimeria praecox TaxID=51316 RepID=U6GY41_9EIME|nr:hypothetical protein, conserved [Eimeria praecox]
MLVLLLLQYLKRSEDQLVVFCNNAPIAVESRNQAFDMVVSNPQIAKCLACTAVPSSSILTVEEAVAAYMDLQLRRAAAGTLPTKEGQTPDTNIWEDTVARLCSRLHFPERFLSAYARLLACRLLPDWATWSFSGRQSPHECGRLVNRLEGIPIHVRLARARRAAGNNHAAYRAFFESTDTPENQRALGSVDVFSGMAAKVCALELRVWEAIQHAFEARCPVPPEEQWRVRQVISDIAAARETLFLYTRNVQQRKVSLAPNTAAVPSDETAAEAPFAEETAEAQAGQHPHNTVRLKDRQATSEGNPDTALTRSASTVADDEPTGRFEALVLTKTAWETYLPLRAPETSRDPTQPSFPDTPMCRLRNHLVNAGGINIPKELHTHLEAFSKMYRTHFPERQLRWLWRAGHADMTVILRQQKHETLPQIHAGTYGEMKSADFRVCLITSFVLLLFNEVPLISAQTAAHLIGISVEEALSILEGLQVEPQNILRRSSGDGLSSLFCFNADLDIRRLPCTVNPLAAGALTGKGSEPLSPQRVRGPLDAEERTKLDARVVKIFKQHRRLTHQQLMQILRRPAEEPSATSEHADCCGLRPEAVKSSLEGLMSKEYIARDESDRYGFVSKGADAHVARLPL